MAEPHRLHGAHGATVALYTAFANPVIFPPTHASTFPSGPLKAFTFSTPAKDWRERRGQCYVGLGGLEGEASFELGQEGSACVHQEGAGGGGEEGERQPGQEPRQRQGREKQPVLGLPVLLSGIGCSDGAPDSGMSQLCFSSPGTCHGQERARLQVTQTTKCRGHKKGRFPTISSVSHLVTLTGIFFKLLILR